jgi:chemotaxis protein MotB
MTSVPQGARPIIVRRVQGTGGHGHHGGAWKVAYADFVTAMMAFFLLLWLISSASDETRKGLAEFFSNATVNIGPPGGVGGFLDGMTVVPSSVPPLPTSPFDRTQLPAPPEDQAPPETMGSPQGEPIAAADDTMAAAKETEASDAAELESRQFDRAKAAILSALQLSPELRGFKDSLLIEQAREGLRIEILDRAQVAMFPVGSDVMYPHTRKLLQLVAHAIADLPNRVSIRGHTDALPFVAGAAYDNWYLSADRANATRLVMIGAGLEPKRVAGVVGKGDAEPLGIGGADDPRNRRISVVLLRQDPAAAIAAPGEAASEP